MTLAAQPLQGNVVVIPAEIPDDVGQTGLIVRPDNYKPRPDRGEVVAFAEDCRLEIAVGNTVLFNPSAGQEYVIQGTKYTLLRSGEIDGVIRCR